MLEIMNPKNFYNIFKEAIMNKNVNSKVKNSGLNNKINKLINLSCYLICFFQFVSLIFVPITSKKLENINYEEEEDISSLLEENIRFSSSSSNNYANKEKIKLTLEDKVLKLQACSAISRERASRDVEHIQLIGSFVNPNSNLEDSSTVEHVLSLMLMSCFKKVSLDKVNQILEQAKQRLINPMTKENQDLVELDKWEDLYISNNNKLVQDELMKYKDIMQDMREAQMSLMNEVKKKKKQDSNHLNEDNDNDNDNNAFNKNDDDNEDEAFINRRQNVRDQDLVLFGYEINKLSGQTKLILGLSLLIFLTLIFGIAVRKALKELPVTKEKKSKKLKKKDE